jgi:hypothetical protein
VSGRPAATGHAVADAMAQAMDETELRRAGDKESTIDRIEVTEFETREDILVWLEQTAPVFVRR